jgi:phage terminase large subunit
MRTPEEIQWLEPKPTAIICDHDANGRRTFEKETGLGTQAALKAVSDGIDTHKEQLKTNDEGYANFYLMADSLVERDSSLAEKLLPTCTADEYPAYIWKLATDGSKLDEPVSKDNHGMDTDRYLSMHLHFKGKARASMIDV